MTATRSRTAAVIVATLALVGTAAVGYATGARHDEKTITACVSKSTGAMRLETSKLPCRTDKAPRERRITWNEQGIQGLAGANGVDGDDGSDFLSGPGAPDPSLGRDGDSYLNLGTGNVYTKAGGVWTAAASLRGRDGRDGQDGPSVLFGSGHAVGAGQDMTDLDFAVTPSGSTTRGLTHGLSYTIGELAPAVTFIPEALSLQSVTVTVTPSAGASVSAGDVTFEAQLYTGLPGQPMTPFGPACTKTVAASSVLADSSVLCEAELDVTIPAGSFVTTVVHTSFTNPQGSDTLAAALNTSITVS